MAESSSIPVTSLGKIQRWMNARKASGQIVQPWELDQLYQSELSSLNANRNASKGLSLQAAGLEETKRMNDINTQLKREEIDAGQKASTLGAVGSLGTTALGLNYLMKDDKTGATPIGELLKAGKNKLFPGTTTAADVGSGIAAGSDVMPSALESGVAMTSEWGTPAATAGENLASTMTSELGTEGAATGAASLGGGATAMGIAGTAAPYIAAARVGMPILGGVLERNTPGEEGSSNVFQQGARITGEDYMRPIEAVSELAGAKLPEAAEAVFNPGGYLMDKLTDTWLCTEISRYIGLTMDDEAMLSKLRRYCVKNHRAFLKEYLEKGKSLVEKINATLPETKDRVTFYANLKEEMVLPVLKMIRDEDMEDAFDLYRDITRKLFDKYAPGFVTIPEE